MAEQAAPEVAPAVAAAPVQGEPAPQIRVAPMLVSPRPSASTAQTAGDGYAPVAPAATMAPATPLRALNDAVVGWFDSTARWLETLPSNSVTTWLGGALLLTRRTLFNQAPVSHAVQLSTSEVTGHVVGTLGVVDPEGDALTYSLAQAPKYGVVQIAPDGTFTYVPTGVSPELSNGVRDTFTVDVADRGFNILDPFGTRITNVAVPVKGTTTGYDIVNMTGTSVKLIRVNEENPSYVQYVPPVGTVLTPGQSFHSEIYDATFTTYDTRLYFAKCTDAGPSCDTTYNGRQADTGSWTVVFTNGLGNGGHEAWCEDSNCSFDRNAIQNWPYSISRQAFLIDAPGTTVDIYPDTPFGAQVLANMLDWYMKKPPTGATSVPTANVTAQFDNTVFSSKRPDMNDFRQVLNLDNYSDNKSSSGSQTISTTYSVTQSSSRQCSVPKCTYDLGMLTNPTVYFVAITALISKQLSANFSVSESETNSKTFSTTLSLTSVPWSVNRILAASPELNANGNVTIGYETNVDIRSHHVAPPPATQTFVFHDMDFVYPDPAKQTSEPIYYVRTEPFQPKSADGKPIANIGYTVVDKSSPFVNAQIGVNDQHQLTVTAFNGYGGDSADYTRRSTYTSSDPSVATVDASGLLVGHAPGKTIITARHDWSIPNGLEVLSDYVIATMEVTVQ